MRALITGGASLVGATLGEALLDEGHEVIAIDDLSSGSTAYFELVRAERERFAFVEHDVSRPFDADVDVVFHLAVPSSRRRCARDPAAAALTCAAGTKHALDLAARRRLPLVVALSGERFGPGAAFVEDLVALSSAVDTRLVVCASAFGPRMDPDRAHPVTRAILDALDLLDGREAAPPSDDDERLRIAPAPIIAEALAHALTLPPRTTRHAPYDELTPATLASLVAEACGMEHEHVLAADDLRDAIADTAHDFALRTGHAIPRTSGLYLRPEARLPTMWQASRSR